MNKAPKVNLRDLLLSADPVNTLWEMFRAGKIADIDPALAALEMPIPAGYRHKNNLDHSIRVLANAIKRENGEADLILRTAALLHDIGKPVTREFHGKGKVTFANHEHAGVPIARALLKRHGYSKDEIVDICSIIRLHMRSHGFENGWTDSAVRRLIADAGSNEVMRRLIVVFYADATTRHEDKLARMHKSTDLLVEAIERVRAADARAALRPAVDGNEVMAELGLAPGPTLGKIMRYLNSDEGLTLSREEALAAARKIVQE